MALPALVRQLVDGKLKQYCENRIPSHVRDEVRLFHRVRGNSVTLVESRPSFWGGDEWSRLPIAQFRYDAEAGVWTLYCADRNGRWHEYWDVDPGPDLEDLLREVDDDPTGIFWG